MTNYAGSRESLGRWRPGSRRAGDLQVLLSNPDLMESGGVLPAEGEMALLPTPNAVDGSGAGSALQSREALEAGLRQAHLTDIPRLLPERDLFPTPVCTDAFGSARHTTATGVMHAGTSLTDAIRLLPTPAAVDGHPSNPGRHNTKGHTTLPGVAKEMGREQPAAEQGPGPALF
jgi:hypothetical protein